MSSPTGGERDARRERALVLGGGGVAGIAWLTGLLFGFEEEGVDLRSADLVAGTSAGSAVGAQLAGATPLAELFARQVDPAQQVGERRPRIRWLNLARHVLPALLVRKDRTRLRARVGKLALSVDDEDRSRRREIIASRLPHHDWPGMALSVSAIDADSGEERWFERGSGVDLVDAVGASCAVPGVWPTVEIGGRRYYDGGIPSPDNAHRAAGYRRVLLLSPLGGTKVGELIDRVRAEVASLEEGGSTVTVVVPVAEARAAMGRNVLDPASRVPSALAGREQGEREAARVRELWG